MRTVLTLTSQLLHQLLDTSQSDFSSEGHLPKARLSSQVTVVSSYSYNLHTHNANPVPAEQDIIEFFVAEKNFGRYHRYFDSKLMMHRFVQQFVDIVPPDEMVVNNVSPGVVATDLFMSVPTWMKPIVWVLQQVRGRTLEEGGRITVHTATAAGKETNGELIRND